MLSGISWAAKLDGLVAAPALILIALVVVPVVVILVISVVVVIPVVVSVVSVPVVVPIISVPVVVPVIPVSVPAVILPVVPIISTRLNRLAGLANLAGSASLGWYDGSGWWLLAFALAPSQVQLLLELRVGGVSNNYATSTLNLGREGDGDLHRKGSCLFRAWRPD